MARELKREIVELIRTKWDNPNSSLDEKEHKGVFPDYPLLNLSYGSYPRISVIDLDEPAEYVGIGSKDEKISYTGQVGIWVKDPTETEQILEIGGEKYPPRKLSDHIKRQILEILSQNVIDLDGIVNYKRVGITEPTFDAERRAYITFINFNVVYIEDYNDN